MREGVSIIHGARGAFESKAVARIWMVSLATHFIQERFDPVKLYQWSGGFLRSYGFRIHYEYALHLVELWQSCCRGETECCRVHIFAKSNGAVIVERALRYLHSQGVKISVGVFLRIATPDSRTSIALPNVDRIVHITSNADQLYSRGRVFAGLFLGTPSAPADGGAIHVEHYEAEHLSHEDFNYPRQIRLKTGFEGETYDLYSRIFRGGI